MGTGKTLGNMECQCRNHSLHVASSRAVSTFFFSVRKENLMEVSVSQLNAKKDLFVCQASIYHGSICLWSYHSCHAQAEYGNNHLILRMKGILYSVVQETLWVPLEMKEREQFTILF